MSNYKLINGNMLEELDKLDENSIDSIVTDPPYELNFMGKGWDNAGISFNKETWKKCLRVLKPGGHLLAFGGSRTAHRIACAIEDAGFEIRDTIMWLYGSGFPKSMAIDKALESKLVNNSANKRDFKNLDGTKVEAGNWGINKMAYEHGFRATDYAADKHLRVDKVNYQTEEAKQWQGWGTQLKPSYEPIIVARKPLVGSIIDNIQQYGVGGINIDECRVPAKQGEYDIRHYTNEDCFQNTKPKESKFQVEPQPDGRFPANTILTYDETDKEEVIGGFPDTKSQKTNSQLLDIRGNNYNNSSKTLDIAYERGFNDEGSASRYFYCAKASVKDRDEGLEYFDVKVTGELQGGRKEGSAGSLRVRKDGSIGVNPYAGNGSPKRNIHPTVKPVELMQYLVRLVTPKGGTILDPFMGSGSTGKAVMYENNEKDKNYLFIGIELEKEYYEIANARIAYADGDIVIREVDENNNVTTRKQHIEKQKRLF